MTGSAKQSIAQRKERMDCFVAEPVIGPAERPDPLAPRNDEETTNRRNSALPRREAPGFCVDRPRRHREGAGKTGCALHPRSRVQSAQKETHTSIQVQRRQSGLPCAVVYSLLRALPGDRAFLPPSSPRSFASRELDASVGAPGPHGFAVRTACARRSQAARPPHPTARP